MPLPSMLIIDDSLIRFEAEVLKTDNNPHILSSNHSPERVSPLQSASRFELWGCRSRVIVIRGNIFQRKVATHRITFPPQIAYLT